MTNHSSRKNSKALIYSKREEDIMKEIFLLFIKNEE